MNWAFKSSILTVGMEKKGAGREKENEIRSVVQGV